MAGADGGSGRADAGPGAVPVVVLTGLPRGLASRCLPALHEHPGVDLRAVVLVGRRPASRRRRLRAKWRKLRRIGLGGAVCGLRMRAWYEDTEAQDVTEVAARLGVPVVRTPMLNGDETRRALRESGAVLAVSLGNDYMVETVSEALPLGTINVHCERLPDYRNAASVIWPIHFGQTDSGFCVHRVTADMDGGALLHRSVVPIRFDETLEASVRGTLRAIYALVPPAVAEVCAGIEERLARALPQGPGASYTTPTLAQFRRMRANHARLRDERASAAGSRPRSNPGEE